MSTSDGGWAGASVGNRVHCWEGDAVCMCLVSGRGVQHIHAQGKTKGPVTAKGIQSRALKNATGTWVGARDAGRALQGACPWM